MAKTAALIVAAGRGRRFGGDLPKQYHPLHGHVVLRHTLQAFVAHHRIDAVQVVIHPDDQSDYETAADGLDILPPVNGGETRQESVLMGLKALEDQDIAYVLVHDAARPNTNSGLIDRVIDALAKHPAVIPVIPVADTLKRVLANGEIAETIDRSTVARAQTPQGFDYQALLQAHHQAVGSGLTDDAGVMEAAGHAVGSVAGEEDNFKITTSEDLSRMNHLMTAELVSRTGQGFDVHSFEPGDSVTLCGVEIPHTARLAGHSDADVALHAITDALLGAVALGDIGDHFPPSDPQWKGAPSDLFLKHALHEVERIGGHIVHLDLTIICEAPKIGPHREAMRQRVAEICGISKTSVSVKATTTEKLGFTGRREGIACTATATVLAPI